MLERIGDKTQDIIIYKLKGDRKVKLSTKLKQIIFVVLIALLVGFCDTYAQIKSDLDTVTTPPTYQELFKAMEIFSIYSEEQIETTLLYKNETTRLRELADYIEMKEIQLEYANKIFMRLSWWLHLQKIKEQNSK